VLTLKLLTFFTLLSTLFIFGTDALEKDLTAQRAASGPSAPVTPVAPEQRYIRTLIVKLPSKFPNAQVNLAIPGEEQPQIFRKVQHNDILTLDVPLPISLNSFRNYEFFPPSGTKMVGTLISLPQPMIYGVMIPNPTEQNPGLCYIEGPLFHTAKYIDDGNDVFDKVPLAKDATSMMKLNINNRKGLLKSYRIFPRTI
jgi:hypothetical protein